MTDQGEPGWGGGAPRDQGYGPPPGQSYGPPPGYGMQPPPAYGSPYPAQSTSGLAIAAFACAISAFFVMPVVGAIVALVLAHFAEDEIRRSQGRLTGGWALQAARVIAWIHLALAVLAVLIVVALIGAFSGWN